MTICDKMHVQCYKKKTAKQFIDFLKRKDRIYNKNIQNILVVLDNPSVHQYKKANYKISRCCSRIKFVFLPIRSPELNLIELSWMRLQRHTINNSTFKDEPEIVRAVSKWKETYNKNHEKSITKVLRENILLCIHSC